MSISFITERFAVGQGGSSNNLVSGIFTPNANALLVMAVHTSDSINSITGHADLQGWVQIGTSFDVSGRYLEIYACHTLASPVAGTVTVDIPYNWNIAVSLLEFTGVDVSGTVAQSFGTPVYETGYNIGSHSLTPAAFADPGNATLLLALVGGGATFGGIFWSEWMPQIGAAGSNGTIGVSWCNFENAGAVQCGVTNYITSGVGAVEIKAAVPNSGFLKAAGNGWQSLGIAPTSVLDAFRGIQFQVPEGGVIGSVFASIQNNSSPASATFKMFLYDASGNLLDESNTTLVAANVFEMAEFTGMTYTLEANTNYFLGVVSNDGSTRVSRTTASAYYAGYESVVGFGDIVLPPDPATLSLAATGYMIYAEYTPAAGGGPVAIQPMLRRRPVGFIYG